MQPRERLRKARLLLAGSIVLAAVAAIWGLYSLPEGAWEEWVDSLSPGALLAALMVLPVFGFPVSVLHIATGARFGLLAGTLAVAVSTIAHLLATFLLAHALEGPLRRLLATFGWHLPSVPRKAAWPFGFWIALLPGVSYALKNAVPPLSAIPLSVYIGTALPTHVAHSLIGLGIGRATVQFSWQLLVILAVYAVVMALLTRRLARHLRSGPGAQAGGPAGVSITQMQDRTRPEDGPR